MVNVMHEVSYVTKIVAMAMDSAKDSKIKSIHVLVGKTSGVLPYYLNKYFTKVVEGTPLDGAELICEEVPVKALCEECGKEYFPDKSNRYLCPNCGGKRAKIIEGKDIVIKSIAVED